MTARDRAAVVFNDNSLICGVPVYIYLLLLTRKKWVEVLKKAF